MPNAILTAHPKIPASGYRGDRGTHFGVCVKDAFGQTVLGRGRDSKKVPTKFELVTNLNAAKCPRKTRAVRFEREGLAMGCGPPRLGQQVR